MLSILNDFRVRLAVLGLSLNNERHFGLGFRRGAFSFSRIRLFAIIIHTYNYSKMSARSFEETIWTIHAMIKQEQSAYRISDYLEGLPSSSEFGTPVDSKARLLIARWLLQVATTCDYSRESAAIAMSCLDRFMASDEGRDILLSRSQFQKAA